MEEMYYEFDCGCRFKQHGHEVKAIDGLPPLSIDFYNLPECKKVWDLFATGNTKGVFQLESNLGQGWSQKLEPWNLEELAALVSILRPGSLEGMIGDKCITQHYVDRKFKREESVASHSALNTILENTHHLMIFQEQSIRIAQQIAGFSESKSEVLRKSIGKKKIELMASLKQEFIEGCLEVGKVNEAEAKEIFEIIEKSQRYQFNKSHAQTYASLGYMTAYAKVHFPLHFFTAWLTYSKEKIKPTEERQELIADAKRFDIQIMPPTLDYLTDGYGSEFFTRDGHVFFGLVDVKGIGESHIAGFITNLKKLEKEVGRPIKEWSWYEFLIYMAPKLNKTVVNNLVLVGATPGVSSRKAMLLDYKIYSQLNDKAQNWLTENGNKFTSLHDALTKYLEVPKDKGGPYNVTSVKKLKTLIETLASVPYSTEDDPAWVAANEQQLMGISLSSHVLEDYDSVGDSTCKELNDGKKSGSVLVVIKTVRETVVKNGRSAGEKMCFVSMEDQTDSLDGVCFSNVYNKHKDLLFDGAVVLAKVSKSDRGRGVIVNSISGV